MPPGVTLCRHPSPRRRAIDRRLALDTHFACTACGRCCHDLRLLLDLGEAAAWADRGGRVQILCDARPVAADATGDDARARYRQARAFAATSGAVAVRITPLLVATFEGACPHLRADRLCGIYAQRPTVCRIYPAEISPFVPFARDSKACPPEAWADGAPLRMPEGWVADEATAALVARARHAAVADIDDKARLCARLGIQTAALADEGFMVHTPDPGRLREALATLDATSDAPTQMWRIVSNRAATVTMLAAAGAEAIRADAQPDDYLGFFPAD